MMSNGRHTISRLGCLVAPLLLAAAGPPEAPVADAAMRGDADAVRQLVADGADVNTPQGDGTTALHWAAEKGDTEILEILLYGGANTEAVTRNGAYTPLHLASAVGMTGAIEILLDAGADVHHGSATGVTALHFGASSGSAETVRALLRHGADVDAQESVWGQTPLIFAAAGGRLEAVTALADAGADVALSTNVIDVADMIAEDVEIKARRDALKAIEWGLELADEGYAGTGGREDKQRAEEELGPLDVPDEERETLSFAQLMDKKGGMSALHHAAREGHEDVALELLARGADVNQTSGDLSTPLLVATINGFFDLAVTLLEHGADPNMGSVAGSAPLFAAINLQWAATSWYPQPTAHRQQETSYLELMKAFLDAGADPNARLGTELWYTEFSGGNLSVSQWGATPFWRAAYGTDVAAMKLLIEYGADPTIPTKKLPERRRGTPDEDDDEEEEEDALPPVPTGGAATYPIHAATGAGYGLGFAGNAHQHAPNGWLPAVKYLVEELGADVNQRDHQGYTPVHNAATRGDNEVILYLVEMGADVTLVSREGQTTADMANGPHQRLNPFPETLALLASLGAINNNRCVGC